MMFKLITPTKHTLVNLSKCRLEKIIGCTFIRAYSSDDKSKLNSSKVKKLLRESASLDADINNDKWLSGAYPIEKSLKRKLKKDLFSDEVDTRIDPRNTTVLLFPGQGAQFVGMGEKLLETRAVKDIFDYASSILKYDLLKLCLKGPAKLLNMTINCQMATMLISLACLEYSKDQNPMVLENCVATAGFSVGEYASLVFAGALTFEDAVQIVKIRGEAMQACTEMRPSGLLTVHLAADGKLNYAMKLAREFCIEKKGIKDPVCTVSNYLFPHCKVVGGDEEALNFLQTHGREFGIRRSKRLEVSGAFHTSLMKPAKDVLKKALDQIVIHKPAIQVYSNVTAQPYPTPDAIRKNLVEQMYSSVKWEQILHNIYTRANDMPYPRTYEMGPGKTLGPILKQVNAKAFESSFSVEC